jgi:putative spermidine/putrescine transport system ATP-binding protein
VATGGTLTTGATQSFALRPEAVTLVDGSAGTGRNQLRGTIDQVSFLGSVVRIRVRFQENAVLLDTFNNPGVAPPEFGREVSISFGREDLLVLDGASAV